MPIVAANRAAPGLNRGTDENLKNSSRPGNSCVLFESISSAGEGAVPRRLAGGCARCAGRGRRGCHHHFDEFGNQSFAANHFWNGRRLLFLKPFSRQLHSFSEKERLQEECP